jgi:hypothetical protein
MADHYPEAAVRHIGDGNGALYIGENMRSLPDAWNTVEVLNRHPGFEDIEAEGFSFEDITIAAARRHPDIVFNQVITANDMVFSEMIDYLGALPRRRRPDPDLYRGRPELRQEPDTKLPHIYGGR